MVAYLCSFTYEAKLPKFIVKSHTWQMNSDSLSSTPWALLPHRGHLMISRRICEKINGSCYWTDLLRRPVETAHAMRHEGFTITVKALKAVWIACFHINKKHELLTLWRFQRLCFSAYRFQVSLLPKQYGSWALVSATGWLGVGEHTISIHLKGI